MASKRNGTLYTGVTSNLVQRVYQHKHGLLGDFTAAHGCKILAYYEVFEDMENAILREKQLKGGPRQKKIALIEAQNQEWSDLYDDLL